MTIGQLIVGLLCLCALRVIYGWLRAQEEKRTRVDITSAERRERERQEQERQQIAAAIRAHESH